MGSYLIPDARSAREAAHVFAAAGLTLGGQRWEVVEGGVLFTDPSRTDAQCASIYAGFVPSGATDDTYIEPVPTAVKAAIVFLKNQAAAGDQQAQATLILFRWINQQIDANANGGS